MHIENVEKDADARFAVPQVTHRDDLPVSRRHHHIAGGSDALRISEEIETKYSEDVERDARPR